MQRCNVKTRDILATTSLLKDMRKLPGIQARSRQENTNFKNGGTLRSSYISMDIEYFTAITLVITILKRAYSPKSSIFPYSFHVPLGHGQILHSGSRRCTLSKSIFKKFHTYQPLCCENPLELITLSQVVP